MTAYIVYKDIPLEQLARRCYWLGCRRHRRGKQWYCLAHCLFTANHTGLSPRFEQLERRLSRNRSRLIFAAAFRQKHRR